MTTPDKKRQPIDPSRRLGAESLHMYEEAQGAIKETRKLLDELASHNILPRDRDT